MKIAFSHFLEMSFTILEMREMIFQEMSFGQYGQKRLHMVPFAIEEAIPKKRPNAHCTTA